MPDQTPAHGPTSPIRAVTRLAPSPTGALHLGNARTFLVNWALARKLGWSIVLRIEDLDGPRVKPGVTEATIDTLAWLGLDWDEGPLIQSDDPSPYTRAMQTLASERTVYPCDLTRAQIEAASSAPQEGSGENVFPRELRAGDIPDRFDEPERSWRFVVEPGEVAFDDTLLGPQSIDPSTDIGDFVVWTKRAQPAYQLAVVVDDARQGVTHVVRGSDLLASTARQLLLYRALGLAPEPTYTHLPLVRGEDGRRLAKRHGDTRLDHYRRQGVGPERVVGLLAHWCGLVQSPTPMPAGAFAEAIDPDTMPTQDVVFTTEDDRWLLSG